MTLHKLHRLSALVIVAYALIHLVNHLVGLGGIESHISFMTTARLIYRFPLFEALLLSAIALQIYSGITFVARIWKHPQGLISCLQAGSGAYLAFFFLNHVGAVILGRTVLHLDTNFYFAAAGFHVPPFQFFFAPYYFLAVLALFIHLGCNLYWRFQTKPQLTRLLAVGIPTSIGFVISLLILLSLAGVFYPVQIPLEYKVIYGG